MIISRGVFSGVVTGEEPRVTGTIWLSWGDEFHGHFFIFYD